MMALRKFFVSAFVVFSFVAYAVHERFVSSAPENVASSGAGTQAQNILTSQQIIPTVPTPVPTAQPLIQNVEQNIQQDPPQQQQFVPLPTDTPVIPTNTPFVPTATPIPPTATTKPQGQYRDGVYTGPEVDVFYGNVQVQATVQNGRITDVQFLDYPHDRRTSQQINSIAMPYLTQEAIQVQSAYVNIISGATLTSQGFAQSLYTALMQAKN